MSDVNKSNFTDRLKHKAVIFGLTALSLFGGVAKTQAANAPVQDSVTHVLNEHSNMFTTVQSTSKDIDFYHTVNLDGQTYTSNIYTNIQSLDNGCTISHTRQRYTSNASDENKDISFNSYLLITPDGKMYNMDKAMANYDLRKEQSLTRLNANREVINVEHITQEQAEEFNNKSTENTLKVAGDILKGDQQAMEAFEQYLNILHDNFMSQTVEVGHFKGASYGNSRSVTGAENIGTLRNEFAGMCKQQKGESSTHLSNIITIARNMTQHS